MPLISVKFASRARSSSHSVRDGWSHALCRGFFFLVTFFSLRTRIQNAYCMRAGSGWKLKRVFPWWSGCGDRELPLCTAHGNLVRYHHTWNVLVKPQCGPVSDRPSGRPSESAFHSVHPGLHKFILVGVSEQIGATLWRFFRLVSEATAEQKEYLGAEVKFLRSMSGGYRRQALEEVEVTDSYKLCRRSGAI